MMRYIIFFTLFSSLLYANALPMPPAILSIDVKEEKKESKQSVCDTIPPMLQMLPPPLQQAVDACQSETSMPTKEKVENYLDSKNIQFKKISIEPMEGFVKLYEIDLGNDKKLYCNEKMQCFEGVILH